MSTKPKQTTDVVEYDADAVAREILIARVDMLRTAPFFGTLVCRLTCVDATAWCPTAGTDGKRIYYNGPFMMSITAAERVGVMAHEVLHVVYKHTEFSRAGLRDHKVLNWAQDYVINLDLKDQGFSLPDFALCEERFRDMSSDQVYDILIKEYNENPNKFKNTKTLDEHMGESAEGNGSGSGQETDPEGITGPVPMTAEEERSIADEIKQAVLAAAEQTRGHNKGLPGRIELMLDALVKPKMRWTEMIRKQVQSTIPHDFTWSRPSRKSQSSGVYLPGIKKLPTVDVVIGVDSSGSIDGDKFKRFLSECYGIVQQFTNVTITFFCWDARCYSIQKFDSYNASDIVNAKFEGGGGNDGTAFVWDYLAENNIRPQNLVMFTDGHIFGPWDDGTPPPYANDTVWVIWGDADINPPWGTCVRYVESDKY